MGKKIEAKRQKTGKIRTKLLIYIMPVVIATIVVLVLLTATLSKQSMTKLAKNELDSSSPIREIILSPGWIRIWSSSQRLSRQ